MDPQITYALMYLEINIIAVVLIAIIRYKTGGISKMVAQRNFAMALDAQMVFFISDTIFVLSNNRIIYNSPVILMAAKEIYFFSTTLMCFFWFVYFEYIQESPFIMSRKHVRWSSVLVFVMGLLLIINLFTGILFYVDGDGVYHRGGLFIIQYLLSYIYVFITCFRALIGIFKKEKLAMRKTLIGLALFPLAPAGAGILQFIYPHLPLACATLSLATLIMYLNWIDEMISVDPLTKLSNRKRLDYNYRMYLQNVTDDMPLYLLIIDANKFKGINDTYGHIEGDAALVRIADAMRLSSNGMGKRVNITRYGGDEFVILIQAESINIVNELIKRIHDNLADLNKEADSPYELTVSVGTAKAEDSMSLKELIEKADGELYEAKRDRR